MIELSDFIAIAALFVSIYALWQSKVTSVNQLETEVFVSANSTLYVIRDAIRLLMECHEKIDLLKFGIVPQDEMNALQKMEKHACSLAFERKEKTKISEKEIRNLLGHLQANTLHARERTKKYEGWLKSAKVNA